MDAYEFMREGAIESNVKSTAAGLFDFSNLPHDHPCYSSANKKLPGKMKDELRWKQPARIYRLACQSLCL